MHDFTIALFEALGTYRLTTKTFWPSDDSTYEGVLLSDLLKKVGLHGRDKLLIKAVDDYAVTIPRARIGRAGLFFSQHGATASCSRCATRGRRGLSSRWPWTKSWRFAAWARIGTG